MPTESTTRKEIIDFRLKEAGWNVVDRTQVIEEFFVSPDEGGRAASPVLHEKLAAYGAEEFCDYVLLGKNGKPLAVVEAKRSSKDAELGREQAKQYCHNIQTQLGGELPFCFYTNGHEIFFWNLGEAPPQKVHGFPTRQDLERLLYIRKHKKTLTNELGWWRDSRKSVANPAQSQGGHRNASPFLAQGSDWMARERSHANLSSVRISAGPFFLRRRT